MLHLCFIKSIFFSPEHSEFFSHFVLLRMMSDEPSANVSHPTARGGKYIRFNLGDKTKNYWLIGDGYPNYRNLARVNLAHHNFHQNVINCF